MVSTGLRQTQTLKLMLCRPLEGVVLVLDPFFLVPTSFQAFFRIDVKGLSGRGRAFLYGMKSWSGKRT